MVNIELTPYEFRHTVYNWSQAERSESIDTIAAGVVARNVQ